MNVPIKQNRSVDEMRAIMLPGVKIRQLKANFDRNMLLILVKADPKYLQDHGLRVNHHQQRFLHSHQLSQCKICLQVKGREGFSTGGNREWHTLCKYCNAASVDPVGMAEYYQQNKEYFADRNAKYYQQNKEYFAEYFAEYYQTPQGKLVKKRTQHKRRAIKKQNVTVPYSLKELDYRFAFFDNRCAYCRQHFPKQKLTIDHFIPVSRGGHEAIYNLFPVCPTCNSSKCDKDFLEWFRKQDFYHDGWEKVLISLSKPELYCKPDHID